MPQLILLEAARKIFKLHGFSGSMLEEAIPYVRDFRGKLIVLKIGGSIIEDSAVEREFIDDVAFMMEIGIKLVLVHGGGKHLTAELQKRGIQSTFVHGLRVTTEETIETAEYVFKGINHRLAGELKSEKVKAHAYDRNDKLIHAKRINDELGFVGAPIGIDTDKIKDLLTQGNIPIVPALGFEDEQILNINADTVAGFIAQELKAEKLILMTDVDGICNDKGELISTIDEAGVEQLIGEGTIRGGMIPKVQTCLQALREGIGKAHIINGSGRTFVNEVLTDKGVGTQIIHNKKA